MPNHYDPRVRASLETLLQDEALDESPESVFALDREGRVIFVNAAWDRFARSNGGAFGLVGSSALGSDYFTAIAEPLRSFYRRLLEQAPVYGESVRPVSHCYECSSSERYREFNMQIYRLPEDQGYLIVNSLIAERPHDAESRPARAADPRRYTGANGLIQQCAHCRRVQDPSEATRWDWVPAWVDRAPPNTSHGLCPVCDLYYFPAVPNPTPGE